MNRLSVRGSAAWLALLALSFASKDRARCYAEDTRPISQVTPDSEWNAVFDRADGWTGADAAGSVDLGDGRTLWMFGDTWIGRIRDGKRLPGARMVNNSIAVHPTDRAQPWRPPDPRSVRFFWGPLDKEGQPTAWLIPPIGPGQAENRDRRDWFWATGGGVVVSQEKGADRRLIVFLFRTRRDPDGKGVWNFATVGTSLAVIDNVSDSPERWRPRIFDIPNAGTRKDRRDGQSLEILWGMSAMAQPGTSGDAGRALVFGTRKSGPFEMGLLMARVPAEIERFGDWRFVGESNNFTSVSTAARPLANGLVSEFSIEQMHNRGRQMWVLVQSEPFLGKRIFVRTAPQPEGPWSPRREIYSVPDVAKNRAYFTYAAKGHAALSRPGELLVTYLVNSQNFGDLMSDTTIYHPKFLRVPATVIFGK
ncbi:MAG TPA: hypothetical protein VFG04_16890 [Planctomycetaceae bacterium]|nr:hypothetical protein [Planctomycetaceae bacterium]